MLRDIKRGASRAKAKLRDVFGRRKPGASATQSVAGDADTDDLASGPGYSRANTPAAYIPSVAISPQPEVSNVTSHSDPAPIVGASSSPEPGRVDAPAAPSRLVDASILPNSHDQAPHPEPTVPVSTPANLGTPTVLQDPEPSRAGASSASAPNAAVVTVMESNNIEHQEAAPIVPAPPAAERRVKHVARAGFKALLDVLNRVSTTVPPLQPAVDCLLKCTEMYEDQISAKEEYNKLWTRLDDLCRDISKYMSGAAPSSMTPCVQSLARGLKEQTELVRQKLARTALERGMGGEEDADEVVKCCRDIEALLQRLSANANLETWRIVEEEATRNRLNELPNSPEAQYKSAASGNLGRRGCTPNTRIDVLEQLRSWAESGESRRIYWLNGMAGTGKTTIAYSLCEHIESASKLAASFFCSRQSPECRDVGRILPSIAYQLSLFSDPFRYAIFKVLKSNPLAHNKPPEEQFESLIATPLWEIKDTLPSDLVIVIDALDECDSAEGMDEMLSALLAHAPDLPVKLLLTSRPNQNILEQMGSDGAERVRSLLHLHDLDRLVVQSDIETYLTTELGRLKLNTTDLNRLVERSGVLFVYAATVVRYLKYQKFARSAERLKQVLSATASDGGEHRELDALYTTVLDAALGDDSLRDLEREQMNLVIRTVVCAQEPLSLNDIAGLLERNAESVRADLGPLLSVLQISESGVVTTLHESFPDYLFDDKRSKQFYCDRKTHNAWFARACFALLKAPNPPFNICKLESSYLLDEEVPGLQDRVKKNISPHLFYACRYWEAHVKAAEPSEVLSDLFDFLSKRLLLWMEIMNLKQEIQGGMVMVSKLNAWLPVRGLIRP
ncbi:hypothetical protein FRC08_006307 [Ceratobasidium sp. 394]|nr:hypothetical protein FRC08_006307 [Ceratobasidium sp. 394]